MFPALVATRENNSYRLSVFNFAGLLILPVNIGFRIHKTHKEILHVAGKLVKGISPAF